MKNIKLQLILSAAICLSTIGIVGTVFAAAASVSVSPASLTKSAGDIFKVSLGLDAAGNNVYAVQGTLVFKNLSCQSITVAEGLMSQSVPTCSKPYFLIGIPKGTTSTKTLMSVSVKAEAAGLASVISTSTDVIGEGVSVASAVVGGNYTIIAASDLLVEPTVTPDRKPAAVTEIEPGYSRYPADEETTKSLAPKAASAVATKAVVKPALNVQTAAVAEASGSNSAWLWIVILIIVAVISGIAWWVYKRLRDTRSE